MDLSKKLIQKHYDEVPTFNAGMKNHIINGNFDIWQRGTTQTVNNYGSADRWLFYAISSTHSISQQAFTVGQTEVPNNPTYYMRNIISSASTAGSYGLFQQPIEDVTKLAGQTVTLSFWAKADASKNIATEFRKAFGSGGSTAVSGIGVTTHALTTSWQKFTTTVDLPSISGKTIGANNFLQIIFWLEAGSDFNSRSNSLGNQSGTFDIAQVQIEKGPVATAFEQRHIAQELALCQRYYQVLENCSSSDWASIPGILFGMETIPFPTNMRTIPNETFSGVVYTNSSGLNFYDVSTNSCTCRVTATATGRLLWHSANITLDAEL